MMKNNPLRSDWDIEEDNNVILTKTSINIDKDQSGICSKTKLKYIFMSPIFQGLILGVSTVGLVLVIVISLWLTSTIKITTVTTATSTTSTSATTTTATTTTAPPSSICSSNTSSVLLYSNQFIYSPTNQLYAAGMLNNQFGIYNAYGYGNITSTAIWTANQSSTPAGARFAAQNDGNLVVYGSTAIWSSHTATSGLMAAFCLQLLDSGNLIWKNSTNSIIWQSNTTVVTG